MTQTAHLHTVGDGGLLSANYYPASGWIEVSETWAYASASTITVPTDATTKYQKDDKVRWKQGGAYKYGIVSVVAATLVTIIANADYTVANSAITDVAYSRELNPFGFPEWFNYTAILGNITVGNGTLITKYKSVGKGLLELYWNLLFGNTTSFGGAYESLGYPVASGYPTYTLLGLCILYDTSVPAAINGFFSHGNATGAYIFVGNAAGTYLTNSNVTATSPFTWATGDYFAGHLRIIW